MVIQKRLTVILTNSNKRPRPHIDDYGKFQIKLILPAKVREYSINASILYHANSLEVYTLALSSRRLAAGSGVLIEIGYYSFHCPITPI